MIEEKEFKGKILKGIIMLHANKLTEYLESFHFNLL